MGEKKKPAKTGHQALYRKYRSKSLSEVVGQEHITDTLASALKQGKVNHAYLFTGPRGTGKTSVARILAHAINDLPYTDDTQHLDIIEIDAASNRRIDDMRDLREKVNITPLSAKYKVYIIDEVHMLTNESFNALLKTLEEPPAHVVFILATTEVHKLPATIISRAQRHSFRLGSKDKIIQHLSYIAEEEGLKIDEGALELLAEHGGGSFRDSVSLLDQMSTNTTNISVEFVESLLGLAPSDLLATLLEETLEGNSQKTLNTLEELLSIGLTPSAIASQLTQLIRRQVNDGNSSKQTLLLMGELLYVHGAQYPQLKLETVLLSVGLDQAPEHLVQPKVVAASLAKVPEPSSAQSSKATKRLAENAKEETEAASAPPPKTRTASKSFDITQYWNDVLQKTKQNNNPLYTVLRLATPEIEDGELVLIFNFPFHQKKLEESKNKALISEIVTAVSGVDLPVKSIVDKKRVKLIADIISEPPDPAHASLISNVQDIMGGGEVITI